MSVTEDRGLQVLVSKANTKCRCLLCSSCKKPEVHTDAALLLTWLYCLLCVECDAPGLLCYFLPGATTQHITDRARGASLDPPSQFLVFSCDCVCDSCGLVIECLVIFIHASKFFKLPPPSSYWMSGRVNAPVFHNSLSLPLLLIPLWLSNVTTSNLQISLGWVNSIHHAKYFENIYF